MSMLPDECAEHHDRSYVDLMAAMAMQNVVTLDEAVEVISELRKHERTLISKNIQKMVLGE